MLFVLLWVLVVVVTVAPVRGRSATGWLAAATAFAIGGLAGWTRFASHASTGKAGDLAEADLPGVLQGVQIHDGPPQGHSLSRVAIIQDHGAKTWAVTAAVVHPGIGLSAAADRHRQGTGLSELLDLASRTELIDEILFTVRTVPEDGAERDLWMTRHQRSNGPALSRQVNDELKAGLARASVRTEAFVTIVIPETRIGREAKECGGGLPGRARVLYGRMGEVGAQLRGGMAMTGVTWLTSPELALVCRTGFAPGDRAGIIDAIDQRESDDNVNADVPWAMAGPSGADSVVRHYSHDAWNSASSTIKLPVKGAAMGALAPVLTPSEPGERRSFMVAYPILRQSKADRRSANSEWAADVGVHLRTKAGVRPRAKQRAEAAKAHGMDDKLARGNSMTRPYAVCTVDIRWGVLPRFSQKPVQVFTVMDSLIAAVAQYLLFPILVTAAVIWLILSRADKVGLAMQAVFSLVIAVVLIKAGAAIHIDPRPFVVDPSTKPLFAHPADNGFPSDHTALAATVAFLVMLYRKWLGVMLLVASVVLGGARMAAHVHHGQDIVAGVLIAAMAVGIASAAWSWARPRLPRGLAAQCAH